ncbi:DUF4412 domain-containing protein [Fodinibius sp. SL11]|uniref:DUF4412 domain-containing protein n=1 Tax=Fodinibius sp. SL11 TaxID=3425690 RepID=UPI003F884C0B
MKKASYYLSAMLLVASFSQQPASAQFEGKITFDNYNYSSEGVEQKDDNFTLYVTSERILLQGEKKYDFMESIQTEGVLVRLDFEDFVFLTGSNEALKISKTDITSMMNMFGNGQSANKAADKADNIDYERTGESATIHGYQADKFIFRDDDEPNEHTEVWMTNELDVNWGMLAESWTGSAKTIISSLPTNLVFNEKYFPLKVEVFENDQLVSKLEATEVNTSTIAKAMVQVPSGVKVLSFQDYLFQKMSRQ